MRSVGSGLADGWLCAVSPLALSNRAASPHPPISASCARIRVYTQYVCVCVYRYVPACQRPLSFISTHKKKTQTVKLLFCFPLRVACTITTSSSSSSQCVRCNTRTYMYNIYIYTNSTATTTISSYSSISSSSGNGAHRHTG